MSPDLVLATVDDGVAVVSYNRPDKHNALSNELVRQWWEAVTSALENPHVRVLLLRGEGPSFSSGRDVGELGQRPGGESDLAFIRAAQDRALARLASPKPIVAALKGYVLGGAFETALTCDLRVADTSLRMGFPEIKHALITDTGGIPLTTTLAGPSRARYLVMTGDQIGAEQALAWGLVDFVVQPDELDSYALDLAQRIAAAPPDALAVAKHVVDVCVGGDVRAGMHAELLAQTALFGARRQQPGPGVGG